MFLLLIRFLGTCTKCVSDKIKYHQLLLHSIKTLWEVSRVKNLNRIKRHSANNIFYRKLVHCPPGYLDFIQPTQNIKHVPPNSADLTEFPAGGELSLAQDSWHSHMPWTLDRSAAKHSTGSVPRQKWQTRITRPLSRLIGRKEVLFWRSLSAVFLGRALSSN